MLVVVSKEPPSGDVCRLLIAWCQDSNRPKLLATIIYEQKSGLFTDRSEKHT